MKRRRAAAAPTVFIDRPKERSQTGVWLVALLLALTVSGEDAELDKTVVEKIGDPLMHLVRNAIDHGIDAPELRAQRLHARGPRVAVGDDGDAGAAEGGDRRVPAVRARAEAVHQDDVRPGTVRNVPLEPQARAVRRREMTFLVVVHRGEAAAAHTATAGAESCPGDLTEVHRKSHP